MCFIYLFIFLICSPTSCSCIFVYSCSSPLRPKYVLYSPWLLGRFAVVMALAPCIAIIYTLSSTLFILHLFLTTLIVAAVPQSLPVSLESLPAISEPHLSLSNSAHIRFDMSHMAPSFARSSASTAMQGLGFCRK